MNLFLHELKESRKSVIIWNISLVATAALYISLFPAFAKEAATFKKMIMSFPQNYLKAFGITVDSYTSINGFYALLMSYITLAGAIQAMNIGTAIVSKEERGMTAEFLLAKPIRRSDILTAKLGAGVLIVLFTSAFFAATARLLIATIAGTSIDFRIFALLSATMLFVQLFFIGLGFLISVSAKRVKSVLSISLSTVFGFYIVGMLDSVLGAKATRYFTPFKYFDVQRIVKNGSYEWGFLLLEAALVIAAIAASYVIYLKRDIRSI